MLIFERFLMHLNFARHLSGDPGRDHPLICLTGNLFRDEKVEQAPEKRGSQAQWSEGRGDSKGAGRGLRYIRLFKKGHWSSEREVGVERQLLP